MSERIFIAALFLSACFAGNGEETRKTHFNLCEEEPNVFGQVSPLSLKVRGNTCIGCEKLSNCTTYDGSIQVQGVRSTNDSVLGQLHFPLLTEITGHLLISLVYSKNSLKDVFPSLAVIRGRASNLFLDYSLVIYQNDGLRHINLPSLTKILSGGVRIENNINLCYFDTVRWKSITKTDSEDDNGLLVIGSNNNDCYSGCYGKVCAAPAGHGVSGNEYCWSEGESSDPSCQKLCGGNCGESGCVDGSDKCCHDECVGGCSKPFSEQHCHACLHLRTSDGECVPECPINMFEIDKFRCVADCTSSYYKLETDGKGMCVKECPAGYQSVDIKPQSFSSGTKDRCDKCVDQKCPKVCKTSSKSGDRPPIDSRLSLSKYRGCTEIRGNLIIRIRGTASSGIGTSLVENLGKIEEVHGYILIRASVAILSLNFLRNLKAVKPSKLYNTRYALAILDNPKLEAMWPFHPNLTISKGGIVIHLNPHLCPSKIHPLVNNILKWNQTNQVRQVDVSDSTNGNSAACNVSKINMTIKEAVKPPRRARCSSICALVQWNEVIIEGDYRNVLFYTISYREAENRNITEYDDADACSDKSQYIWSRVDITVDTPPVVNSSSPIFRVLKKYIEKLKAFTLYAFKVEAVVLKNEGAKSDLFFFKTREQVPSQPVGLEVSYLNSHSLNVKWKPPLFPNGIITEYIVEYNKSSYSIWKEKKGFDWCSRQIFSTTPNKDEDSGDGEDNSGEGSCKRNVTCDCDKTEVDKPERQAAIFAKEFQDKLYKTIFVKRNDNNDHTNSTPTTAAPTTVVSPSTNHSVENCSAQGQGCESATSAPTDSTGSSTKELTPTDQSTAEPTDVPAKPVKMSVNASQTSLDLHGLDHFSDYTVKICACTKVGCATGTSCSMTKGRTDKNVQADNLHGLLKVSTDTNSLSYNVSWVAPPRPNAIVLKYEVEVARDSNEATTHCKGGRDTWHRRTGAAIGNYSARVRAITPAGNGSWSEPKFFALVQERVPEESPRGEDNPVTDVGTVVGASLAACCVFVLAGGLIVWYIARKRYGEKQVPGVLYASVNPEYMNAADVYIADEWEIPRDQIKLTRELGNGSFGMVYEGEASALLEGQLMCRVAVKTVSENASTRDRLDFLQEASIMKAFDCNHVVRLLGVVSAGQPTLVVMELMEHGDLKNFLRSRRPEENGMPPPTLPELLQMTAEIADGMAYLAARKFVHRDLAARNCMVNADYTVKIGDFGMTRDIYETDYYRKGGKGLLPVRWMGSESLKDGVFTSASDVWSFGVVLWEMATLAAQPYPGKSNEDVLKYLINGGVMEKPEDCPDKLYDLMTLCWQHNPKARPTFVYLVSLLEKNLTGDFRERSFYHSLQCTQLERLLNNHYEKHRPRAETVESTA